MEGGGIQEHIEAHWPVSGPFHIPLKRENIHLKFVYRFFLISLSNYRLYVALFLFLDCYRECLLLLAVILQFFTKLSSVGKHEGSRKYGFVFGKLQIRCEQDVNISTAVGYTDINRHMSSLVT